MQFRLYSLCLAILFALISLSILIRGFAEVQASESLPLCVVPAGEPTGPYAACRDVLSSVQMAVDTAVSGDTILLAAGVYSNSVTAVGQQQQLVYIDKDLIIKGGYAPPFDLPPTPSVTPSHLRLQPEDQARLITIAPQNNVLLEGLTLSGGIGQSMGELSHNGGGILVDNATLIIRHSHIYSNSGSITQAAGSGGGLYAKNSMITMTDSIIEHNVGKATVDNEFGFTTGFGGGLAFYHSSYYLKDNLIRYNVGSRGFWANGGGVGILNGRGELISNQIVSNTAAFGQGFGGGVALYAEAPLKTAVVEFTLERNLLRDNFASGNLSPTTAADGGGLFILLEEKVVLNATLEHNQIINNQARLIGGGAFIVSRNQEGLGGQLMLNNNEVLSNSTTLANSGIGAGLVFSGFEITSRDNRIEGNQIAGNNGQGAGVYVERSRMFSQRDIFAHNVFSTTIEGQGGGLIIVEGEFRAENSIIMDNRAAEGSGIAVLGATAVFTHPTIPRNDGESAVYVGKSIYDASLSGSVQMVNSIITESPIAFFLTDHSTAEVHHVLWHQVPIKFALADGYSTATSQITADPLFAADGYHLLPETPAKGQGMAAAVTGDIDHEGRPFPPTLGADEPLPPLRTYLPFVSQAE